MTWKFLITKLQTEKSKQKQAPIWQIAARLIFPDGVAPLPEHLGHGPDRWRRS
jgi:hypothetical protein